MFGKSVIKGAGCGACGHKIIHPSIFFIRFNAGGQSHGGLLENNDPTLVDRYIKYTACFDSRQTEKNMFFKYLFYNNSVLQHKTLQASAFYTIQWKHLHVAIVCAKSPPPKIAFIIEKNGNADTIANC